jgi:hypothetical protein
MLPVHKSPGTRQNIHSRFNPQRFSHFIREPGVFLFAAIVMAALLLAACTGVEVAPGKMLVTITADGKNQSQAVAAGSTVQQALNAAGITLGNLDRVEPTGDTAVTAGMTLRVVRVKETYDIKQVTIPFEHQVVRNESMPAGQSLLIQPGVNGTQEITNRHVIEDGKEVSVSEFKRATVQEPVAEIMMVGVQAPFTAVTIPGRLAYLTGGNAWVMSASTADRRPVVTSGDLDGHIFSLSADGNWLLFSRKAAAAAKDTINSLWVIDVAEANSKPIDLHAANVVHYAGWVPGSPQTITYSTVEPRSAAPGWQANNDVQLLTFSKGGNIDHRKPLLGSNSGGLYGWWGATFAWSPDGSLLAYARPDSVGLVDLKNGVMQPRLAFTPYQTRSDWAWVPDLAWSPDGKVILTVTHAASSGMVSAEASPLFNLTALLDSSPIPLATQVGMFAYPRPSAPDGQGNYQIAYLQAIFPDQSETSRYRMAVMDQDGSNHTVLFPDEGSPGLDAQAVVWSPKSTDQIGSSLAVIYQNNLWLVDPQGGAPHQITGDGLVSRIDWK